MTPTRSRLDLSGFLRQGDSLVEIASMNGHVSPRLKVRFELGEQGLQIMRPDGQPFLTYEEMAERAEQAGRRAEQAGRRAEQALAEVEKLRQRLRGWGRMWPSDTIAFENCRTGALSPMRRERAPVRGQAQRIVARPIPTPQPMADRNPSEMTFRIDARYLHPITPPRVGSPRVHGS